MSYLSLIVSHGCAVSLLNRCSSYFIEPSFYSFTLNLTFVSEISNYIFAFQQNMLDVQIIVYFFDEKICLS